MGASLAGIIDYDDTSRFLPSMLQRVETPLRELRSLWMPADADYSTHLR
jgi:hypothetical protein